MDLLNLFEMQRTRDDLIRKERGLEGVDLLSNNVLALQSTIGKVADAWRGHMYWNAPEQQTPKKAAHSLPFDRAHEADYFIGEGGLDGMGMPMKVYSPLLERYTEALEFILSIASEVGYTADDLYTYNDALEGTPVDQMNEMILHLGQFLFERDETYRKTCFRVFLYIFWNFGEQQLGLDFEEIAAAYVEKSAANVEQQALFD